MKKGVEGNGTIAIFVSCLSLIVSGLTLYWSVYAHYDTENPPKACRILYSCSIIQNGTAVICDVVNTGRRPLYIKDVRLVYQKQNEPTLTHNILLSCPTPHTDPLARDAMRSFQVVLPSQAALQIISECQGNIRIVVNTPTEELIQSDNIFILIAQAAATAQKK